MIILDLILNLSLLVALGVLSGFARDRFRAGVGSDLLQGIIFGSVALIGMRYPLVLGPGLIFDGRSVVISLCGFFFGPAAAGTAAAMALCLRIVLGGVGVYMGVAVILSSAAIGSLFYAVRLRRGQDISMGRIFVLGLAVHLAMLVCILALPFDMAVITLKRVGLAIILLYPVATVALGRIIFDNIEKGRLLEAALGVRNELYATLYSIGDAVITTDVEGRVARMNDVAANLTGFGEAEASGMALEDVFHIINEQSREKVKSPVGKVLETGGVVGLANHTLLIAKDGTERPIADSGAPIRRPDGQVAGVVLVFRDQTGERAARLKLAESEERFRTLVENAPDAIFVQTERRFAYLNKACLALLGAESPEELLGRPVIEFFHPDFREQVTKRLNTLYEGRMPVERAEETMLRLDGSSVETEVSAEPFRFSGKNGAIVFVREITARKKAARQIEGLNRTYRVLSNINQAIVRTREPEALLQQACRIAVEDGGFLMAWLGFLDRETGRVTVAAWAGKNGDYLEKLDISLSDESRGKGPAAMALLTGKYATSSDIEHDPRMAPWREDALRLGFRSAGSFPFSVGGTAPGVINFYSEQPDFFDEKEVPVLEELAADISFGLEVAEIEESRLRASAGLAESEERFRRVLDNIPDVVVLYDETLTIRYINSATEKVTGLPASHFIGKREEDLWPPEVYNTYMPALKEALESGETRSVGVETELPGAGQRFLFITCVPISAPGGKVREIVGITHDLTGFKRAEREKSSLNAQLLQSQKMEAVGQLAGGVAHDFNNMLGVILGNAELALGKLELGDVVREDINEIVKAGKRSADLTGQLLAFARRQAIAPRVLDLNDTISGMMKMLARLISEDIELVWKPGPGSCVVKMDPAQINQVLANLVVNSRDAISGVGRIIIETSSVCYDADHCADNPGFLPGRYVQLSVSDDGSGMDSAIQAKLFEPFFTTKEMGKGTGLGLATVYGIVRQNEGFVKVYSEPGMGSTFRVFIPHHEGGCQEAAPPAARAEAPKGSETVLLVEDELALLKITSKLLTQLGYKVLASSSPLKALEMAGEYDGTIHLLVTDVIMPEMSGRDLMEAFSEKRPGIKCLYLSGYTSDVIAHHGVLEPGVEFLQKPFSKDEFAAKLREALAS